MIFSSTIFLFGFLPLILLCYAAVPRTLKNGLLLLMSLAFYAWGEIIYTAVMLFSILWNFFLGMAIERTERRKVVLTIGISANLLLLGYFKYSLFATDMLNTILTGVDVGQVQHGSVHLPLGISFFTFQAISYLIDVYRGECRSQKNLVNLGLYIAMFPQLIAGPIVRYSSVARQLIQRTTTLVQMEQGVLRFVYGLAKKLLIANPLGEVADAIFALPQDQLPAGLAWVAILAYTLQIYFDFSGYSDMAIGLGKMFGFHFPENFNYPYIARNLRDFWRRWHMSLTSWLRDYLYIPLGGSRVRQPRLIVNLFMVFFLCGLWHGASWNFVVWGMWHGVFLGLERGWFGNMQKRWPEVVQHVYLLVVVVTGWVFFRAEDLGHAVTIFSALGGLHGFTNSLYPVELYISNEAILAAVVGIVISLPLFPYLQEKMNLSWQGKVVQVSLMSMLLFASFMKISSGTYNPFLYFRF